MSATYALFTAWKARKGITSDNQGALALGVSRMAASAWKNGRNAEIPLITKMAREIDEDPAAWAMRVFAERSTGEERRAVEKLAREMIGGSSGTRTRDQWIKSPRSIVIWTSKRLFEIQIIIQNGSMLDILTRRKVRIAPHHLLA